MQVCKYGQKKDYLLLMSIKFSKNEGNMSGIFVIQRSKAQIVLDNFQACGLYMYPGMRNFLTV